MKIKDINIIKFLQKISSKCTVCGSKETFEHGIIKLNNGEKKVFNLCKDCNYEDARKHFENIT